MKKQFVISLLILLFINACRPPLHQEKCDNPNLQFLINKDYAKEENTNFSRIIINEGGYTHGNASITAWNQAGNIKQNAFQAKNNYNIGDVLQSGYYHKDDLYLIVNNSQKIEIIDKYSLQRKKTITGFTSPRYMTTINNIALVTDIYSNSISVFRTSSPCELEPIKMKGWTEQIFTIKDKIYVIERSEVGASLLFANIVEIEMQELDLKPIFKIIKRTSIAIEPQSVGLDKNENIWILSSGKESESVYPTFTKFNTTSNTIEKIITYNSFINIPQNLATGHDNSTGNMYYNQGSSVYEFNINDNLLPTDEFINTTIQNIYSISYNAHTGYIYVSDAKDYVSNGTVVVYNTEGEFVENIPAGIIPSKVIF